MPSLFQMNASSFSPSTPRPFAAGDKVVCVDDSPGHVTKRRLLAKGAVYHVTDCWLALTPVPVWVVSVLGIDLGHNRVGRLIGFAHTRFRRVWTQQQRVTTTDEVTHEQEASS